MANEDRVAEFHAGREEGGRAYVMGPSHVVVAFIPPTYGSEEDQLEMASKIARALCDAAQAERQG